MKYRKKPVVIEANLWDGNHLSELMYYFDKTETNGKTWLFFDTVNKTLYVHTLEGDMKVPVGNYVISGVEGELYSCDPQIFEKTYEKVEDV